ncbi:acid phosphatase [Azomonas macrocytogenes]|uniref:acid phosphatase n=1 Tax=Azomonas macrocytogenes TaxID=69962 RepID=A0A839T7P3_AZOMA|nr:phosphatase PAP2 family protein [Azomonas macrocytogenes]MBB3104274.1 membrane-associated phospholipid phosphatase [Azomonas macrocytogenes]
MHSNNFVSALIISSVLFAPAAFARGPLAPAQIAPLADTVTAANPADSYQALLEAERKGLVAALGAGAGGTITQDAIDKAKQEVPFADTGWLKASGYDFTVKNNQDAGIKVLSSFITLPRWQLERSLMTVAEINHGATPAQQQHAIVDAQGQSFLYFLPEALGPRLGAAFLRVYEMGEIGKAVALIKASEISTGAAKSYFNYPRPFLIDGNSIGKVPDNSVVQDGSPYKATGGSYPSGHTNTGYTDALLLAEMLPERFVPLLNRAAGYGYSRVVLGVHYPLDVIGSRMVVERNVAHFLNDPAYKTLFDTARDELRAALEKECGVSITECARVTDSASDPWATLQLQDFYRFTMTYDLPQSGAPGVVMQVPEGAQVLLGTLLPNLSAEQRKDLLARTAIDSGYPLDSQDAQSGFWQRIDLHAAALAAHSN